MDFCVSPIEGSVKYVETAVFLGKFSILKVCNSLNGAVKENP
jgi:hypothetical protein